ncbi:hypothetical protein P4571_06530 [Niallia alba]|uniref:hypothetical protein n=1 Tax=Niallia alba TaxID=2729105 RepID=UPI002E1EE218|nr:hypothetical protein [Niallia alba]
MDRKTLEYLEERSKKGRELVERIERLNKFLEQVKGKSFHCIKLAIDSSSIEMTGFGTKQVELNYAAVAEAHMLNAFIDVTNAEIKIHEKELDEL